MKVALEELAASVFKYEVDAACIRGKEITKRQGHEAYDVLDSGKTLDFACVAFLVGDVLRRGIDAFGGGSLARGHFSRSLRTFVTEGGVGALTVGALG